MRVVEIDTNSGATESYDMSWFSDVETTATYQEAKDYARNYWEKKATSHSVWEVLYQGTYTIKK